MSYKQTVLNSSDLAALIKDDFAIEIVNNYLVVWDIPYVTKDRTIERGVLAMPLDINGDLTAQPSDHQVKFIGDYPCTHEGIEIEPLRQGVGEFKITETLIARYNFSNKPSSGHFLNYYEKVTHYVAIISGPAQLIDPDVSTRSNRVVEIIDEDIPFKYLDANSARAGINVITAKLADENVAIIGLGGTGSYILDFIAKTPVRFIHLFDGDVFSTHNAFRAPGAASLEILRKPISKVDYFESIYSNMHKGITPHSYYVDESCVDELRVMNFVFICMDASPLKQIIIDSLEQYGITFIDAGMGLYAKNDMLGGTLQAITSTPSNRENARKEISFNGGDVDNEYDNNIQIADLNCMNALLAVIRWKKLHGFYMDSRQERSNSFTVGSNLLLNENEQNK